MKGTRTIKSWITYGLAPLLLIILSISVYREIAAQPDLSTAWIHIKNSFNSPSIGWLIAALVGVMVNWGLEAAKWKRLLKHTEPVSFGKAYRGVLTGVAFTLFTPNRIGEYLGRIWHLSAGSRAAAISLSVAGSIAQLFITCLFGMIATEILWRGGFQIPVLPDRALALLILKIIGWGITIFLILIYFSVGEIGMFMARVRWLRSMHTALLCLTHLSKRELLHILGLSFFRYMVFLFQYYCLFCFFDVALSLSISFLCVALLFLLLALLPGMALAELGVRGKLSLLILGAFSANSIGIVLAATGIWFMNLIIPAVVGGILMQGRKQV
ncbi:MAG: lysylphosphatidylglycerol synthase domain-containing protein [Bacteroidota bacterium]